MTSLSRRFTSGVVLTNLGLLAALISGPNLGHANPAVQYGGLAVMVLGLLLMGVDAIARRRNRSSRGMQR
jgi:membrane protein implicated in regulation of membrane protease activity